MFEKTKEFLKPNADKWLYTGIMSAIFPTPFNLFFFAGAIPAAYMIVFAMGAGADGDSFMSFILLIVALLMVCFNYIIGCVLTRIAPGRRLWILMGFALLLVIALFVPLYVTGDAGGGGSHGTFIDLLTGRFY